MNSYISYVVRGLNIRFRYAILFLKVLKYRKVYISVTMKFSLIEVLFLKKQGFFSNFFSFKNVYFFEIRREKFGGKDDKRENQNNRCT